MRWTVIVYGISTLKYHSTLRPHEGSPTNTTTTSLVWHAYRPPRPIMHCKLINTSFALIRLRYGQYGSYLRADCKTGLCIFHIRLHVVVPDFPNQHKSLYCLCANVLCLLTLLMGAVLNWPKNIFGINRSLQFILILSDRLSIMASICTLYEHIEALYCIDAGRIIVGFFR